MVIKRSKFEKRSLEKRCRRAQVVTVRENEFQLSFNAKEFILINKSDSKFYEKPGMKLGVLCTYDNQERGMINTIYSLDGKKIYERKD